MAKAKSIFELLTAPNPDIDYQKPRSKTVTYSRNYHWPKQLIHWTEFSFSTLIATYGKKTISELRQEGRLLPEYPVLLPEVDCVVVNEPTTVHVLTKWNHTIVTAALGAVRESLHPSAWMPKTERPETDKPGTTTDKSARGGYLDPDAGAVPLCQGCCTLEERLPKDYKTASKWHSSAIINEQVIDERGEWRDESDGPNRKAAMPIRQVYTYCIWAGCRYGCILTTKEAFIFRIKPRSEMPPVSAGPSDPSRRKEALQKSLTEDGLMEYVSIPWGNHNNEDPDNYGNLTINLALWFIHVLAGNAHQVDWSYDGLQHEKLKREFCAVSSTAEPPESRANREGSDRPQQPPSQSLSSSSKARRTSRATVSTTSGPNRGTFDRLRKRRSQALISSSPKRRRRNSTVSDAVHLSFASIHSFATQSTSSLTETSTQLGDDDGPESQ